MQSSQSQSVPASSTQHQSSGYTGGRLQGYLHTTNPGNLPAIRKVGLLPHESTGVKGIGEPSDKSGAYHPGAVYVVDTPQYYKGDTRGGTVGVVSAQPPTADLNYPHSPGYSHFGAGYFEGAVPPLREAMTQGRGAN